MGGASVFQEGPDGRCAPMGGASVFRWAVPMGGASVFQEGRWAVPVSSRKARRWAKAMGGASVFQEGGKTTSAISGWEKAETTRTIVST
jgi:hypothetical protein